MEGRCGGIAAERRARLLGRAYQGVGIVRILGFLGQEAPKRSLSILQKLHTSSLYQRERRRGMMIES